VLLIARGGGLPQLAGDELTAIAGVEGGSWWCVGEAGDAAAVSRRGCAMIGMRSSERHGAGPPCSRTPGVRTGWRDDAAAAAGVVVRARFPGADEALHSIAETLSQSSVTCGDVGEVADRAGGV
jgi:hypothetical protein